ncbi:MAG: bifunctional methylenetetrahydrofolate dehydrogenase/methenyltetrahydrofolate cyclohydrolase FolD [Candidatus Parcubacteria bacterium]|jgi:5,10-methylene-tetrahydrofolate dehydrogenase/methenyl tetrahydrofolate cyclohydrolase
MADILDGKKARDSYKQGLFERSKRLSCTPALALIQIGDNRESTLYIEQKKKFALDIHAQVEHIVFKTDVTFEEVQNVIKELNARTDIHGIIVQLPLPAHLDSRAIINIIDPQKDVDGLTDTNQTLLESGKAYFVPATARGVLDLLKFYHIEVKDKNVVVFGRSRLVGSPIAHLLKAQGAHVSVCHSKTEHPQEISKQADIVIVAIGKPELIDTSYIKEGVVVIDVGINSVLDTKTQKMRLVGDVDHANVEKLVKAISPVPGGVGPMTVLSLFANLILSAEVMCRNTNYQIH